MTSAQEERRSFDGRTLQAAQWHSRLRDSQELSPEELQAWEQFIVTPANHEAFERVQRVAGTITRMTIPALPSDGELAQDDYDGSVPVRQWKRGEVPAQARRVPRTRVWILRSWSSVGAAAAGLAALVGFGIWAITTWHPSYTEAYVTAAAEHRIVQLKDGSAIALGARTMVEVEFSAGQRRVHLRQGEAFFTVAHDATRPFIVFAGTGTVTAVGTQFNVWRDLDRTTVSVAEGAVDVQPTLHEHGPAGEPIQHENPARVGGGHEVSYVDNGLRTAVKVSDIRAATAWRDGRLEYRQIPLRYVVSDVNRYFADQLVIGDVAVGELPFSGAVPQSFTAAEFAHALETIFHVKAVQEGGRIVIHMRLASTATST